MAPLRMSAQRARAPDTNASGGKCTNAVDANISQQRESVEIQFRLDIGGVLHLCVGWRPEHAGLRIGA
jgi:hypothetical protein